MKFCAHSTLNQSGHEFRFVSLLQITSDINSISLTHQSADVTHRQTEVRGHEPAVSASSEVNTDNQSGGAGHAPTNTTTVSSSITL